MSPLSPFKASSLSLLVSVRLLAPQAVRADVDLDVGGSVEVAQDTLGVRIEIRNRGDSAAAPLDVEGELLGRYDTAHLEAGVGPRGSTACTLRFPSAVPRPGVHLLALDLRFVAGGARVSRRGYLLLALGSNPEPAVRVSVTPARLETRGHLQLALESADGEPHRVRVRVLAPLGLNPDHPGQEHSVPAAGQVGLEVGLTLGVTLPERHQGILVVAETTDGKEERTTVASAVVEIVPFRPWLPRLRRYLVFLALGLLGSALGFELWRRWPSGRPPVPSGDPS